MFRDLDLKYGDRIWILNAKGEGFHGVYFSNAFNMDITFMFSNFSNGKVEVLEISELQRLEVVERAR